MASQSSAEAVMLQQQQQDAVWAIMSESAGRGAGLAASRALNRYHRTSQEGETSQSNHDQTVVVMDQNVMLSPNEEDLEKVKDARVGGVLSVKEAALAAGNGAYLAVQYLADTIRPNGWPLCSEEEIAKYESKIKEVQITATASATTAVYAVAAACRASRQPNQEFALDPHLTELAVTVVTRAGCFLPKKSVPVNRWATLLPPILAACLPTAAASSSNFGQGNHWIALVFSIGFLLLILCLVIGVIAVPLPFCRSWRPEEVSRHCVFCSVLLILMLGAGTCASHFTSWGYRAVPLGVGSMAAGLVVSLYFLSRKD